MSNKVSVAALKDRVVVVVAGKDDAARKDAVGEKEEEEVNNPRVANDRVPRRKAIERDARERLESMTDLMIAQFWLVSQKGTKGDNDDDDSFPLTRCVDRDQVEGMMDGRKDSWSVKRTKDEERDATSY